MNEEEKDYLVIQEIGGTIVAYFKCEEFSEGNKRAFFTLDKSESKKMTEAEALEFVESLGGEDIGYKALKFQ